MNDADTSEKLEPLRKSTRFGTAAAGLIDQGIVSVVNFLTVILLARYLPLAEFGLFMVAHTILLLLTGLQNALVAQPHNILGAQRSGHDYARLTVVLGVMQLLGSTALALLIAGAGVLWSFTGSANYAHVAYALALVVPAWMAQEFVRRALYTQGDIVAAGLNNFISYGLQLVGIVIVVLSLGDVAPTPVNALLALGASSLVASAFGLMQLHTRISPHPSRNDRLLRHFVDPFMTTARETWRLSKWLVAQQGIAWLGASGHGLLLTALLGPAAFGIYRAAYQVVNLLNPLRQAAINHLPSKTARVFAEQGVAALGRWSMSTTLALTIPFALCALAIVLGAKPIAALMFGSALNTHTLPEATLQLIVALGALSYTLNFARAPIDYAVLVAGGARAIFLRTLWLNAFVVTGGILLILGFGIAGVVLSELITALLAAALTARVYAALLRPSSNDSPSPANVFADARGLQA